MKIRLQILWNLVKRDYAVQYAGSMLGIFWMLIQNMSMIFIYTVVFIYLGLKEHTGRADYIPYLFSGLLFWLPLQELLLRGTGILTENRHLIKRSSLGAQTFIWIPFIQYLIHFIVTALPIYAILYYYQSISWFSLAGILVAIANGLYVLLMINYLARLNVILKDVSPLVGLLLQFSFWGLPILYYPAWFNAFNPFFFPLELFRYFTLNSYKFSASFYHFFPWLGLFLIVYYLSKTRLNRLVADHL